MKGLDWLKFYNCSEQHKIEKFENNQDMERVTYTDVGSAKYSQ